MPGLVVTTGVRVGATGTTDAPASSFFIVGTAERGPADDYVLINSMTQAEAVYGDRVADGTLYDHLEVFFEEGGTRAYVRRVVGSTADTADAESLGTNDALNVTPVGQGTWANTNGTLGLGIQILAGVTANTSRVKVVYKGETLFLSGDCATNRALAEAINGNVGTYLVAEYDDTEVLAPAGSMTYFTGGVDDNAPTDTQLVTGLTSFVPELGAGAVAIPQYAGPEIWTGLREHALANSRIALCAFESTTEIDGTGGAIETLETGDDDGSYYGDSDAQKTAASVMAFFWPWVTAPNGTGGTNTLSPESFAAAARCRAHLKTGAWRPAAGAISASRFVNGLSTPVNSTLSDTANDGRINPLRVIDGGVRVYGARSVSGDEANWKYITYRDTLNYIVVVAERRLEPFIFNVIDSRRVIFSDITATLVNLLEPLRQAGGVYEGRDASGKVVDRGYTVEVSDALNPQAQLAAGVVSAKIGVRVSSIGETINLVISKSNLTTAI